MNNIKLFEKYSGYKFPVISDDKHIRYSLELQNASYRYSLFLSEYINEEYINDVIHSIVNYIENHESYIKFNSIQLPALNNPYNSVNIWDKKFDKELVTSIDIKQANFRVLNIVMPEVFNSNSYEEFFSRFSNSLFLKKSKYLRQVIFGKLNPKRIQYLQKKITLDIADILVKNKFEVISVTADEVIIRSKCLLTSVEIQSILEKNNYNLDYLRIEEFRINYEKFYFTKENMLGELQLKNVPKKHYIRALSLIKGEDNRISKLFEEDGILYEIKGF
jgi:hypothetical protein